jgi:hypothetical protein
MNRHVTHDVEISSRDVVTPREGDLEIKNKRLRAEVEGRPTKSSFKDGIRFQSRPIVWAAGAVLMHYLKTCAPSCYCAPMFCV